MKPQQHQQKPAQRWVFFVPLAAVSLALMFLPDGGRGLLSFDRSAISGGEVWRLVSGHFVHLGVSHTLLNIGGILLIAILCGMALSLRAWLLVLLVSVVGTSIGLWFGMPMLENYVGLSGVLHGILVGGLLAGLAAGDVREPVVLLIVIAGKLAYEQFVGPLPGSEASAGGAVIVNAHLYGALSGALAAGLIEIHRRRLGL